MCTLIALFRINRRKPQNRTDRFLIAFLGVLTIYEALKLLKDQGVVVLEMNSAMNDMIELLVAMACLAAAVLLQASRVNHLEVESAMRLARAAPPRIQRPDLPVGPRDFSTVDLLTWAIPRLSDGAFKLLAVLCLRSDMSTVRVPVGVTDVQLKLGKSKDELDRYLKELQDAGAIAMNRRGATLDIEIVNQGRRPGTAEPVTGPPTLATEPRI